MESAITHPEYYQLLTQHNLQRINFIAHKITLYCRQAEQDELLMTYFHEALTTRAEVLHNIQKYLLSLQQVKKLIYQKQISLLAVDKICRYMEGYISSGEVEKTDEFGRVNWLFDIENKLRVIAEFIHSLQDFKDDITTLSNRNYSECWKHIHINYTGDPQKIWEEQQSLKKLVRITTAAIISQEKANSIIGRMIAFAAEFPRAVASYSRAEFLCLSQYRRPNLHTTKSVWNLWQNGTFYHFQRIVHPLITTNKELYLPRNIYHHADIHVSNDSSVKVRLLHYKKLRFKNKNETKCYMPYFHKQEDVEEQNTIMIYFNGGGFVALSSFTMQSYTRKWANQLKIPIFCIDYRKLPQHRFPAPVIDAVDAYRFITEKIHEYVNIRPKKIILAGDSAGGNIVCALMGCILNQNLRQVHSMFLAYPAINTSKIFSPSRLNSFHDPILYPTLLLLCLKEYLADIDLQDKNPYASPILFTEEHCGGQKGDKRWPLRWPRTCIVVGKNDPLYDDALKMIERMVPSNINCHCEVYNNYSHGFLSQERIIQGCDELVKDSIKFLKELIR